MHWELPPVSVGTGQQQAQLLQGFPAGLLYGYGVYTTFRWPLNPRWLEAHLDRLHQNAHLLGLSFTADRSHLLSFLEALFQPDKPVMRLSVVADVNSYGGLYQDTPLPGRLLLSVREVGAVPEALALQTVRYQRPLPGIKLAGMPQLVQYKRQAKAAGFDDILLVSNTGALCETSTANIFLVREGRLITPDPQRVPCLPGITRLQVLDAAKALDFPVEASTPLSVFDIQQAQGAFITNAAQGIIPVSRIDDRVLPWPKGLREQVRKLAQAVFEF